MIRIYNNDVPEPSTSHGTASVIRAPLPAPLPLVFHACEASVSLRGTVSDSGRLYFRRLLCSFPVACWLFWMLFGGCERSMTQLWMLRNSDATNDPVPEGCD